MERHLGRRYVEEAKEACKRGTTVRNVLASRLCPIRSFFRNVAWEKPVDRPHAASIPSVRVRGPCARVRCMFSLLPRAQSCLDHDDVILLSYPNPTQRLYTFKTKHHREGVNPAPGQTK